MEEEEEVAFKLRLKKMREEAMKKREEKEKEQKLNKKKISSEKKIKKRNEETTNINEQLKKIEMEKKAIEEAKNKLNEEIRKLEEEKKRIDREKKQLADLKYVSNRPTELRKKTRTCETVLQQEKDKQESSDNKTKRNTTRKKKNLKAPLTQKQLEEKRRIERERKRNYRNRIYNDPEKHLQLRLIEKLRSKQRRDEGKIKKVSDMTQREARKQRKLWRLWKQNERKKKSALDHDFDFDTPPESPASPVPGPSRENYVPLHQSKKKPSSEKKVRQVKYIMKKKVKDLECRISKENKESNKWKQRYYREKKKTQHNSPTPRKMAAKIIKEGKNEIRRQLVFGCAIKKQLQSNSSKCKTPPEKRKFSEHVSGPIVKKYRLLGELDKGKISSYHLQKISSTGKVNQMVRVGRIKKIRHSVQKFFQDDENSVQTPGKRQFITRKKVKKQKRFLLDSIKNLHSKFVKTTGTKISYDSFRKLRPFWVVPPKEHERDTCKCIRHANFELMMKSLVRNKVLNLKTTTEVLESVSCDVTKKECMYGVCSQCNCKDLKECNLDLTCLNEEISYFQWVRKLIEKHSGSKEKAVETQGKLLKKKKTKIVVKEKKTVFVRELIENMNTYLKEFCVHVYNSYHQREFMKNLKKDLKSNEVMIIMDWSENYSCKHYEEIQSMHFGGSRKQISLHTGVVYSKDTVLQKNSFCTVSEINRHDAAAVWAHVLPIIKKIKETTSVDTVHFFSDGPTTQYRNKENLYLLTNIASELDIWKASWNYSEAGHGKGPADAIGGVVKRTADSFVLKQKDVFDMRSFAESISSTVVMTNLVEEREILEIENKIPPQLKVIPSTMKIHQVTWVKTRPHDIGIRLLSCQTCSTSLKCTHYSIGSGIYTQPCSSADDFVSSQCEVKKYDSNQSDSNKTDSNQPDSRKTDSTKLDSQHNEICSTLNQELTHIEVNSWVAVIYDQLWYPGKVEDKQGSKLHVKFMQRNQTFFMWPANEDRQVIDIEGVLCILKEPIKVSSRLYKFEDTATVDELCGQYIDDE